MNQGQRPSIWVLDEIDNVGSVVGHDAVPGMLCALRGAASGEVEVRQAIPHGHKIALRPIETAGHVIKYGVPVGRMTAPVTIGEHVHVHNMESLRGRGDISGKKLEEAADCPPTVSGPLKS